MQLNLKPIEEYNATAYAIFNHTVDVKSINVTYLDFLWWCSINCSGRWNHIGRYFYFEEEQDKVYFLLKWC